MAYLRCEEFSGKKYQERWITAVDRLNSLLSEVDRIYCIIKRLDLNIGLIIDFVDKLEDAAEEAGTFAEFKAALAEIEDVFLASETCKP